jgi:rsbT co-antagonist protein RsbR
MAKPPASRLPGILSDSIKPILTDWLAKLRASPDNRLSATELEAQCESIITRLAQACRDGNLTDIDAASFATLRELLADLSRARALQGFSPTETATFILSLKQPLFGRLRTVLGSEPERLAIETLTISELIDALGLFMMETFQRAREEVIIRQQTEISELSTPVVKLWQGVLALPLIGTLDSARTQVVMENLLDSIVRYEADIAIIDITGVPTVDTLVAQHLLKTVAAARLMGADCIISGIRPQIAQTMVHLGVELNVVSKANLSDAFALALRRLGKMVVSQKRAMPTGRA